MPQVRVQGESYQSLSSSMIRFHIGFIKDWILLLDFGTYHINSELCLTGLLLLCFLFLPFRGCWNLS